MPENEIIPDAVIPDGVIPVEEAVPETAREKFERERLSRRQALKRLGMTSAMATFALFSVDDLARMVGKAMQQRAGDNKIAEQVAQELQQAGVAMAGTSPLPYGNCNMFQTSNSQFDCMNCNRDRFNRCIGAGFPCDPNGCGTPYLAGNYLCGSSNRSYAALQLVWVNVCTNCLANCN